MNLLKKNWFNLGVLLLIVLGVLVYFNSRNGLDSVRVCVDDVNRQFDGVRQDLTTAIAEGQFTNNPNFLVSIINADAEEYKQQINNCY